MKFYLGTHEPTWLNRSHVPLFISAVRLRARCKVKLPRARVPWALDSGGFSVLGPHSRLTEYPQSAEEYAAEVRRWSAQIGLMAWAAIQDWMCEQVVLAKTGLTVLEHQIRTVRSWCELRSLAPELPWLPVLQGFTHADYLRCLDLYAAAGTDLTTFPLCGIGSVCRRENTAEAEAIIFDLAARGLRLHGFGFKLGGLERCASVLASADSLAWSFGARQAVRRGELTFGDQNSPRAALGWLSGVRVKAQIAPERDLLVCPFCESLDVHPPMSSELDYACVDCGEAWADIRQPTLLRP